MGNRVCVLGASGFIGANLVARLKADGHWVRAIDINDSSLRGELFGQADEVRKFDLRYSDACQVGLSSIDTVFHLAADHGGAGYFYGDADWKAARNNLLIDLNVLKELKPHQRLFFASSACTFPTHIQGREARPLKETDWGPGMAEQQYGEAKRMTTILMEGARHQGFNVRSGIFHTIYGPGQTFLEPRAKFPTAICRKILDNPKRVEIWGDGTQVRTFLYVDDAVDRILTVMDEPYEGPVNIGSDEEVTVQQCAEWVAEAAGVRPEWVYTNGPTGVAHRVADNSEWDRRYGRGELVPAREGFRRTFGWLRGVTARELAEAA